MDVLWFYSSCLIYRSLILFLPWFELCIRCWLCSQ